MRSTLPPPRSLLHLARRGDHRIDDQLIASAAADVAGEQLANGRARLGLVLAAQDPFVDDVGRAHRDSRRADAALGAAADDELLLHRMKDIAPREALDRRDL